MAVTAEFTADFNQFNAAVKDATAGLATMEGQTQQLDAQMADLGYKAGQAIRQIATDLTAAAGTFLDSYAEEEAATQRLITALQAQGPATDAVITDFAAMATQFQNTTRFSDDMVTSAQALFTTIGRVGPQDMQAAITAAANLATVLRVDLNTAATMVARAVATNGESLGKLAPLLADVNVKGLSAAEMFALINEKTGPAAADALKTYAGQTAYLANQMDDARGKIGALLAEALLPLVQAFTSLPAPLQTAAAAVVALGVAFAPVAVSIGALTPLITTLAGAMGVTLVGALTALSALLLPGAGLVAAITAIYLAFKYWDEITAIAQRVYEGIKTYMVDRLKATLDELLYIPRKVRDAWQWLSDTLVGHSIVPEMIDAIAMQFDRLDTEMVQPALAATQSVTQGFSAMASAATQSIAGTLGESAFAVVKQGMTGYALQSKETGALMDLEKKYGAGGFLGYGIRETPAVNVTINGALFSTREQIGQAVGDAVTQAYRTSGNRLPV